MNKQKIIKLTIYTILILAGLVLYVIGIAQ